ncbi:uncharacterized protein LOC128219956 isoform X2 [Mya arenaria]|uniref:uncharacterized protein LOC128219956 isoform X2 n=1 Tax=Mya arenaria TaxID=6604 RepID=UPI0022E48D2B|nr:uncharacterized protein LOC128219956 isoform X2 [Mya arenaria]
MMVNEKPKRVVTRAPIGSKARASGNTVVPVASKNLASVPKQVNVGKVRSTCQEKENFALTKTTVTGKTKDLGQAKTPVTFLQTRKQGSDNKLNKSVSGTRVKGNKEQCKIGGKETITKPGKMIQDVENTDLSNVLLTGQITDQDLTDEVSDKEETETTDIHLNEKSHNINTDTKQESVTLKSTKIVSEHKQTSTVFNHKVMKLSKDTLTVSERKPLLNGSQVPNNCARRASRSKVDDGASIPKTDSSMNPDEHITSRAAVSLDRSTLNKNERLNKMPNKISRISTSKSERKLISPRDAAHDVAPSVTIKSTLKRVNNIPSTKHRVYSNDVSPKLKSPPLSISVKKHSLKVQKSLIGNQSETVQSSKSDVSKTCASRSRSSTPSLGSVSSKSNSRSESSKHGYDSTSTHVQIKTENKNAIQSSKETQNGNNTNIKLSGTRLKVKRTNELTSKSTSPVSRATTSPVKRKTQTVGSASSSRFGLSQIKPIVQKLNKTDSADLLGKHEATQVKKMAQGNKIKTIGTAVRPKERQPIDNKLPTQRKSSLCKTLISESKSKELSNKFQDSKKPTDNTPKIASNKFQKPKGCKNGENRVKQCNGPINHPAKMRAGSPKVTENCQNMREKKCEIDCSSRCIPSTQQENKTDKSSDIFHVQSVANQSCQADIRTEQKIDKIQNKEGDFFTFGLPEYTITDSEGSIVKRKETNKSVCETHHIKNEVSHKTLIVGDLKSEVINYGLSAYGATDRLPGNGPHLLECNTWCNMENIHSNNGGTEKQTTHSYDSVDVISANTKAANFNVSEDVLPACFPNHLIDIEAHAINGNNTGIDIHGVDGSKIQIKQEYNCSKMNQNEENISQFSCSTSFYEHFSNSHASIVQVCSPCQSDKQSDILTHNLQTVAVTNSKSAPVDGECAVKSGDFKIDELICTNAFPGTGAEDIQSENKRQDTEIESPHGACLRNTSLCGIKTNVKDKHYDFGCSGSQESSVNILKYSEFQTNTCINKDMENVLRERSGGPIGAEDTYVCSDCVYKDAPSVSPHAVEDVASTRVNSPMCIHGIAENGKNPNVQDRYFEQNEAVSPYTGDNSTCVENQSVCFTCNREHCLCYLDYVADTTFENAVSGHCSEMHVLSNKQEQAKYDMGIDKKQNSSDCVRQVQTDDRACDLCNTAHRSGQVNSYCTDCACTYNEPCLEIDVTDETTSKSNNYLNSMGMILTSNRPSVEEMPEKCFTTALQGAGMLINANDQEAIISFPETISSQTTNDNVINSSHDNSRHDKHTGESDASTFGHCLNNDNTNSTFPLDYRSDNVSHSQKNNISAKKLALGNYSQDQLKGYKTDGDLPLDVFINDFSENQLISFEGSIACCTKVKVTPDSILCHWTQNSPTEATKNEAFKLQVVLPNMQLPKEELQENRIITVNRDSVRSNKHDCQFINDQSVSPENSNCDELISPNESNHSSEQNSPPVEKTLCTFQNLKNVHINKNEIRSEKCSLNGADKNSKAALPSRWNKNEITGAINTCKVSQNLEINCLSVVFDEYGDIPPPDTQSRDPAREQAAPRAIQQVAGALNVETPDKKSFKNNNLETYRDAACDKMSGLSTVKITTQKSSCNQVFSETSIPSSDFIQRYEEPEKKLNRQKHLTSLNGPGTYTSNLQTVHDLCNSENNRDGDIKQKGKLNNFSLQLKPTDETDTGQQQEGCKHKCVCENIHVNSGNEDILVQNSVLQDGILCTICAGYICKEKYISGDKINRTEVQDLSDCVHGSSADFLNQADSKLNFDNRDISKNTAEPAYENNDSLRNVLTKDILSKQELQVNLKTVSRQDSPNSAAEIELCNNGDTTTIKQERLSVISNSSCVSDSSEQFVDALDILDGIAGPIQSKAHDINVTTGAYLNSDINSYVELCTQNLDLHHNQCVQHIAENRGSIYDTTSTQSYLAINDRSVSVESFQDAVEHLDDDYLTSIKSQKSLTDVDDDNEEVLSQTSSFDSSVSPSFNDLSEWEDFGDDLEDIIRYDSAMEREIKANDRLTNVYIASCPAQNASVDNASLKLPITPSYIRRCSQIGTNVLRSNAINNEPEQKGIKDAIFKTGNGMLSREIYGADCSDEKNDGSSDKLQDNGDIADHVKFVPPLTIRGDNTKDSSTKAIYGVNSKIETALIKRTQRRRRRQVERQIQHLKNNDAQINMSPQNDKTCSKEVAHSPSEISRDNGFIEDPDKPNSTHSMIACTRTDKTTASNKTEHVYETESSHDNSKLNIAQLHFNQSNVDKNKLTLEETTPVKETVLHSGMNCKSIEYTSNESHVTNNESDSNLHLDNNSKHTSVKRQESEFDDIKFIDADSDENHTTNKEMSEKDETPSPNITYTLTYEETSTDTFTYEVVHNDKNEDTGIDETHENEILNKEHIGPIQNSTMWSSITEERSKPDPIETNRKHHDDDEDDDDDDEDDGVSRKKPIQDKQTTNNDMFTETVKYIGVLIEPQFQNKINGSNEVPLKQTDSDIHENDELKEEHKIDICEESNISVAHALKLERQKMGSSDERSRKGIFCKNKPARRLTTDNIVVFATDKNDETSLKPDVRSLKKSTSFRVEKKDITSRSVSPSGQDADELLRQKKVSDMCLKFMTKTRSAVQRTKEEPPPTVPPVPNRKLMKWVNANGKWMRIPVDDVPEIVHQKEKNMLENEIKTSEVSCNEKQPVCDNCIQTVTIDTGGTDTNSKSSTQVEDSEDAECTKEKLNKNTHTLSRKMTDWSEIIISNDTTITNVTDAAITAKESEDYLQSKAVLNYEQNPSMHNIKTEDTIKHLHTSDKSSVSKAENITTWPDQSVPPVSTEKSQITPENVENQPKIIGTVLDEQNCGTERHQIRQDMLLGLLDSYNRRKPRRFSRTSDGYMSPVTEKRVPLGDSNLSYNTSETTRSDADISTGVDITNTKPTPKLTAVKIQEEIYESRPTNELSLTKARSMTLPIRKSKTYAGFGFLDSQKKESDELDTASSETQRLVLDTPNDHDDDDIKVTLRAKPPDWATRQQQRHMLLSEIAEVEEQKDDLTSSLPHKHHHLKQQQQQQQRGREERLKGQTQLTRGHKRRSLSLPTGSLAFGDARIVYKNGHFTFETMETDENDLEQTGQTGSQGSSSNVNRPETSQEEYQRGTSQFLKSQSREVTEMHNKPLRRQYGKTILSSGDSHDDVFYNSVDQSKCFKSENSLTSMGQSKKAAMNDSCSSRTSDVSTVSSVSEHMDISTYNESISEYQKLSSSSLPEVKDEDVRRVMQRAKRTSSFRQAQEVGALRLSGIEEDKVHNSHSQSESMDERRHSDGSKSPSVQNQNSSTFIKKMMSKRKTANENLSLNAFTKQSESAKDFFSKKMTLKGLFKKNKSESSLGTASPVKTDYPATPPIAVFQDDDIDSAETPPSSPFVNREFRRRHTSADIYRSKPHPDSTETDSNCPTPTQERSVLKLSISTPSTPVHDYSSNLLNGLTPSSTRSFRDEDSMSVTSVSSATSSVQSPPTEQPNKPKTPKPVGASPRRNPSLSRMGSQSSMKTRNNSYNSLECDVNIEEFKCECELRTMTLGRRRRKSTSRLESRGSSDSLTICQYCKLLQSGDGSAKSLGKQRKQSFSKDRSDSGRSRKDSATRGNYDRLGIMLQTEVASSNSNDSGIQRDASLHSSSDSLKAVGEGKIQSHRDPSSSPLPDRAQRSEVGVRWADVEDSGDTTPIVMRAHRFRDRPRPQSDIAGSSFLSERVRAFGSEVNLQPYSSLRNLYEMRRRDLDKQKNRRMSTPHPIKSRLQRAPRRLQKQLPLVRSSSMPESLDKLHKRRKLHHLLDFHIDSHLDGSGSLSSDSDLSFDQASLQEKSLSVRSSTSQLTNMEEDEEGLTYAEALWDHITMDPEELAFRAQDVIEVHDMADKDWWFGAIEDREGWFPAAFVRLRVNQEEVEEEEMEVTMVHETLLASPKLRRVSMLNKNQARTNVVNEIINAEREYVKHLRDVVEGYIVHARKRTEMFGNERIELIFGNIETIYGFAQKFLQKLEMCFDVCPHLSEIGQCFLDNHRGFEIYSDYCNNHPSASEELKDLCRDSKYKHFFEACRLLQDLVEIPLEGFLLTPVQKICKYPLQLAELLKYTPPDHADYKKVSEALSAMRKIATLINERKRKMESIEKIAAWQQSVVDWEGPDLLECSSELIFSGELTKVNTAGWAQERSFFLFDHQLIYCKKDLLKRHVFSYKGRIDLDHCDITSVEDGKDPQYSTVVKNAWKFHETEKDKWYLVSAKSPAGKERWLKAIQDQKQRVQEDQENDFCVPDHWKQTVLNKVRSQSHIKDKHSRRPLHSQSSLHKDFKESGFSTLPRQRHHSTDKHDKKSFWSKFGGKKTKR